MGPLLLVFLGSGAAGLIYQVVWVRQFENCFGSSVYSAALVTAIFMLGLGVGSYLAGRVADRHFRRDPARGLLAYGIVELAIGALGITLAWVLPPLVGVVASSSSYVMGEHGWFYPSPGSWALRGLVALFCLGPITVLMGATLTLLIRYVVAEDTSVAAPRIALLYATNTVGAALGSIATDALLVPAIGLVATQCSAAVLNLIAAAWAIWRAKRGPRPTPTEVVVEPPSQRDPTRAPILGIGAAMLLTGFASMAMQLVWFRQLSSVLRAQRNVFSTLLAVLLFAYALGALTGGVLARRTHLVRTAYAACMAVFAASALIGLATLVKIDPEDVPGQSELLFILTPVINAVLLPSFFVGATFPLANAAVQALSSKVGERAGLLYLGNTFGAVLGTLVVGLALIPRLGVMTSASLAAAVAIAAALFCSRSAGAIASVLGSLAVAIWFMTLPADRLALQSIPERWRNQPVLAVSEGVNETLVIVERPGVERRLITNGHSMSSTTRIFQRYMRLFSHLPLLMVKDPKRALVICFGVGNTANAALQHPIERLDLVDLSQNVLEHAPFFRDTNGDVLGDPRVQVYVNDGRQHLRMQDPELYDLITAEPPPLSHAGVASLYSKEFYQLAKSRLKPGGVITQWLPLYQVPPEVALSAVRAFIEVFPSSALLSGTWTELILIGRNGPQLDIDPDQWSARLTELPAVQRDLDRVFAGSLTELLGTFAASGAHLELVTKGHPAMTDDRPVMEYGSLLMGAEREMPRVLFEPSELRAFCPACYRSDSRIRPELGPLLEYLALWGALYARPVFLAHPMGTLQERRAAITDAGVSSDTVAALIEQSPYVRFYLTPTATSTAGRPR